MEAAVNSGRHTAWNIPVQRILAVFWDGVRAVVCGDVGLSRDGPLSGLSNSGGFSEEGRRKQTGKSTCAHRISESEEFRANHIPLLLEGRKDLLENQ